MRRSLKVALAVVIASLFVAVSHALLTKPRLYRQCLSPDRSWNVSVYRSRGILSVPVIVRASMADSSASFERVIDAMDTWDDVAERYSELRCGNDRAEIGPKYWDGRQFTYFVLQKTDVVSRD